MLPVSLDSPMLIAPSGFCKDKQQDEEKQNKNTPQYVCNTTMRNQTQIMEIGHKPSYK
jgi:hypothetical protein